MMTADLKDGWQRVRKALEKCDRPAAEISAWCKAMLESDRVGFTARKPRQSLRQRFQTVSG